MPWTAFIVLAGRCFMGYALHFGDGMMRLLVITALIALLYKLITDTLRAERRM